MQYVYTLEFIHLTEEIHRRKFAYVYVANVID